MKKKIETGGIIPGVGFSKTDGEVVPPREHTKEDEGKQFYDEYGRPYIFWYLKGKIY